MLYKFKGFINEGADTATGTLVNKKYFTNILSNRFEEIQTVNDNGILTTTIKGSYLTDAKWNTLVNKIENAINLIEIYSIESNGVHFHIYHK